MNEENNNFEVSINAISKEEKIIKEIMGYLSNDQNQVIKIYLNLIDLAMKDDKEFIKAIFENYNVLSSNRDWLLNISNLLNNSERIYSKIFNVVDIFNSRK